VSAFGWIVGRIADAREIEQFALVAVICSLIWMLLGTRIVEIIRFPLAFLFFAVPFGASLIAPLQDYTAWFAVHALTLSNVPAVLDGRTISLPDSSWTVAETCSGIRYLFASIVLALVFGSLMYRSRRRQLIFLAASVIVPILANGVRAYGIVLLGYLTDNKLATGVDHVIYGLIFFCALQVILLAGGLRWRESSTSGDRHAASYRLAPSQKPAQTLLLALAAVLVTMIASLWAGHLWSQSAAAGELERAAVSVDSSWQPTETSDTSWTPDLRDFDEEFTRSYRSGGNQVDLWMAFYSGKRGMQFVGSTNRLSDPKLALVASTSRGPAVVGGVETVLNQSLLQFGSRYRAVWTGYRVDGVYTASPARVKLLQAKARLFGRSPAAMVLAVSSEERVDHPMSMGSVLQDFLRHADFTLAGQPRAATAAGMDVIGKDRSNTSAIR
jgi:exosortase A